MREKNSVQVRFLLGPAGSGKTFRCLAEIRAELLRAPDGPPLIMLAPKQATFQLERQLLAGTSLPGYTRLQIISFERLAQFMLETLRVALPSSLSEEGRVMVLRALLMERAGELKRFDKSARRPGFAQQLSGLLAELQSHQLSAPKLIALSQRPDLSAELQAKLHDLGVLQQAYATWLLEHELQDVNLLLDAATDALRASPESKVRSPESRGPAGSPPFFISCLWLDGFAEMTPQELDLLAAVLPFCEQATLAFCLDSADVQENSWLSIWSLVGKSYQQCRQRIENLSGCAVTVETLTRSLEKNRFAGSPILRQLEEFWTSPLSLTPGFSLVTADLKQPAVSTAFPSEREAAEAAGGLRDYPTGLKPGANENKTVRESLRLVTCANPDAEAALAAREVLKFVRSGGRFRDAAVLVRHFDGYQKPLERAFRRYDIPFFLDRREGVAHHPVAELTRSALRTVAFDWQHEDWFAALKAGFSPGMETEIDRLENEALARGWRGAKWRKPLSLAGDDALADIVERLREKLLPPFDQLATRLESWGKRPTGAQLAEAVRKFWAATKIEERLEAWTTDAVPSSVHLTVWEQMNAWLDNLALAFPREALPMRDWLPVIEAGLANLTVGVIPPALDQVLIGAIDRSRNPDLRLAFVLGLNEGVFPATPAVPVILSDADRDELGGRGVGLGSGLHGRLARERYFGYIACTRSSERLVLTLSNYDADGRKLNPSPFVSQVKRLFPNLEVEEFHAETDLREAEHVCELVSPLVTIHNSKFKIQNWTELLQLPALLSMVDSLAQLRNPDPAERLSPALAEALYGPVLKTSVSRLEHFAACPFRFLVHSGLRAEERKIFELDSREQGSFQHEVLKIFHEELQAEGKRWRDLTPGEARARVGRIAHTLMVDYREGLLSDSPQTQFTARVLARALQDFIEVVVGWMRTRYQFDPAAVELDFNKGGKVPAWKLELGGGRQLLLRGRIDRVDLSRLPGADTALCVVIDYKSGEKQLDPVLLEHGVQLQLLSYLNVLRQWPDPRALGVTRLVPAGVFYVNLRGGYTSGASRATLADAADARKEAYRHTGRFDASVLHKLDASGDSRGEQFNFRLTKEGQLYANSAEALSSTGFSELLAGVETQLREMGGRIFSGDARVDPYRKGTDTPCRFCDYAHVCRIDPWTHEYRVLRKAGEVAEEVGQD